MPHDVYSLLKQEEGFRGKPYLCSAGKTTIGYGHNLDDNPLTREQGERILKDDVAIARREITRLVPVFGSLSDVRQAVLLSMIFQLGYDGLRKFQRTLTYVNAHRPDLAAAEMLDSKWARDDTPERANRHARMYRNNTWDGEPDDE